MFEQMEALFAILLKLSRILFFFYLNLGFFFLFLFFHEDAMCHIVTHVDVWMGLQLAYKNIHFG